MITGSRDVDRETARTLFEQHLSPFLSQGRTWLVGTARGIDHWAMEWLLENSESCWAVVPYTRFKQPQWVQALLDETDRVVELQLPKRKTASAIRNRHAVDLAGIVFARLGYFIHVPQITACRQTPVQIFRKYKNARFFPPHPDDQNQ